MIGLLAVFTVCATVLLLAAGAERVLSAKWQADRTVRASAIANAWERASQRNAIEGRRVAVDERRVTLEERRFEEKPNDDPMPADLIDRIRAWEDDFAQEDQRKVILDLYSEYRDWDLVRQKLPAPTVAREGMIQ